MVVDPAARRPAWRPGALTDVTVDLRPMTRADLPDLLRWLLAPHVGRWFRSATPWTDEVVEGRYGPRIDGSTPDRMFVVTVEGEPVGFVQDYRIGDHPEFALLTAQPDAIGVDYAIGVPGQLGRGVGVAMLRCWFGLARAGYPEASTYFAAPDHRNVASRRLLLAVGFMEGLWFDEPQADGTTATMVGHTLDVTAVLG